MQEHMLYRHILTYRNNKLSKNYNHAGMTIGAVNDPQNPKNVLVSIAICCTKDTYCRKTGKEIVLNKTPESVLIKDLPEYLANYAARVVAYKQDSELDWSFRYWKKEFAVWALKFI